MIRDFQAPKHSDLNTESPGLQQILKPATGKQYSTYKTKSQGPDESLLFYAGFSLKYSDFQVNPTSHYTQKVSLDFDHPKSCSEKEVRIQ